MAKIKTLKDRVIETKKIEWRKLKWFQNETLKELTDEEAEKMLNSFSLNDIIRPFSLWYDEETGTTWIMDGHHMEKLLKLGEEKGRFKVPKLLSGTFIHCENREEAAKVVLANTAKYAKLTHAGLDEFLVNFGLDVDNIKEEFDFAADGIDFSHWDDDNKDYGGVNKEFDPNEFQDKILFKVDLPSAHFVFIKNKLEDIGPDIPTALYNIIKDYEGS